MRKSKLLAFKSDLFYMLIWPSFSVELIINYFDTGA